MREELPRPGAANRRMAKQALILVGLLCAPVIGLALLQIGVFSACGDQTTASGVASGRLQWRVTKMTCRNGATPYFDVAIGAEGEMLATALTSHGSPVPLEVTRLDDSTAAVRLDRARAATGETLVRIKLRRSGSPSERVDLQADRAPKR